jgi:hypothetical protein
MFAGFLLGKNAARRGEQEAGAADSAVKGAVAGLAALLLAFSFSLAAGRYDQRNTLVVREANSIRNAWLRADLLEEPTGLLVGHSFGRAGRRYVLTAVVFALLVTLVVSVILDLDRPRRGVIRENFGPLENLRATMRSALSPAQQATRWFLYP